MNLQFDLDQPIEATRNLIKFCEEQDYKTTFLDSINACLSALESGDKKKAVKNFEAVPLGGMGCFNDWMPTPKKAVSFSDKSLAEISKQFDELVKNWSLVMRSLKQTSEELS